MKKIIAILAFILFGMFCTFGQGGPPGGWPGGGNGNGGPPNPPPGYCDQNPQDPSCNNTSVPVSSTEGMIIFMFLAGTFFIYKMNGNSFKFNKS